MAESLLKGCDILGKFPCGRASIPFWHLSGSLLLKLPEILSTAPDHALTLLEGVAHCLDHRTGDLTL